MRCLQGCPAFGTALGLSARLRHRHLAVLLGVCDEGGHLMAVHELHQHGSLEGMLDGTAPAAAHFTWAARLGLGQGLARALAYLHQGGLALQLLHVSTGQGHIRKAVRRASQQSAGHSHDSAGWSPAKVQWDSLLLQQQCAEGEPKPTSKAVP